jgi:hypothetical protein
MFGWGFLMWILLIVIGTFIRGPGWIWFWPGQTWDHNAVVFDKNVDLHDMIATSRSARRCIWDFCQQSGKFIFGLIRGQRLLHCRRALLPLVDDGRLQEDLGLPRSDLVCERLFPKNEFEQKLLARTSLLQYLTFQFFAVSVLLAMPVKLILRLALTIKYVWVTPWFNI